MSQVPFFRFSRGRDPDYEARRLKRRFAAIWREYEQAMKRRREMSQGRFAVLVAFVALGSFGACWGLLLMFPGLLRL
jgi:hypothetical protein